MFVRNPRRSRERGFTLAELMAVVTIVGVLAVVGVASIRQHINSSRMVEGSSMIQSIRAGQERYRAETRYYLNVSSSLTSWYPNATPGKTKHAWDNGEHTDSAEWRLLGATATGPVQFGYVTRAGVPGSVPEDLTMLTPAVDFTQAMPEGWYVIVAQGDTNGDGTKCYLAATSFSQELYVENAGE